MSNYSDTQPIHLVRYSATPEDNYVPYKRRARVQEPSWTAPEHSKASRYMERAYPYTHDGRKMVELGRELILDGRPTIMKPERKAIFLGLDQPET